LVVLDKVSYSVDAALFLAALGLAAAGFLAATAFLGVFNFLGAGDVDLA